MKTLRRFFWTESDSVLALVAAIVLTRRTVGQFATEFAAKHGAYEVFWRGSKISGLAFYPGLVPPNWFEVSRVEDEGVWRPKKNVGTGRHIDKEMNEYHLPLFETIIPETAPDFRDQMIFTNEGTEFPGVGYTNDGDGAVERVMLSVPFYSVNEWERLFGSSPIGAKLRSRPLRADMPCPEGWIEWSEEDMNTYIEARTKAHQEKSA